MKKRKIDELEINQIKTSLLVFMESYNKTTPASFPRVSAKILKKFQTSHPSFFKHSDEWSIDKHRKKLMDWLFLPNSADL